MRIDFPFANQFAAAGGFLQGANQGGQNAMKNALAMQQLAIEKKREEDQAEAEKARLAQSGEALGFEKFKFGETPKQQAQLEQLRNSLLGQRETALATQHEAGESSRAELERTLRERLADQAAGSHEKISGMQIAAQAGENKLREANQLTLANMAEKAARERGIANIESSEKIHGTELKEKEIEREIAERRHLEDLSQRGEFNRQIAKREETRERYQAAIVAAERAGSLEPTEAEIETYISRDPNNFKNAGIGEEKSTWFWRNAAQKQQDREKAINDLRKLKLEAFKANYANIRKALAKTPEAFMETEEK